MRSYVAAALGGGLGALARWAVGLGLRHDAGGWPWSTLLVNLVGCLLIGVLLAVLLARFPTHPWLRPFLATGVLGGFTTFSTFTVDVVQLVHDGGELRGALLGGGYLLASVLGGVAAVVLGLAVGRAATGRRQRVEDELTAGEGVS